MAKGVVVPYSVLGGKTHLEVFGRGFCEYRWLKLLRAQARRDCQPLDERTMLVLSARHGSIAGGHRTTTRQAHCQRNGMPNETSKKITARDHGLWIFGWSTKLDVARHHHDQVDDTHTVKRHQVEQLLETMICVRSFRLTSSWQDSCLSNKQFDLQLLGLFLWLVWNLCH
jgi:hypothetical protein